MSELDNKIKEIEEEVALDDSPQKKQELLTLKAKYEELSLVKAEDGLIRLKQTFYDQGEKPGKLLAWQIKRLKSERAINAIRNEKGILSTDPTDINNTFVSYYKTLYSSDSPLNLICQNRLLNGLIIPRITEDIKSELDKDINLNDILSAITGMRGGKASGPGGLPIDLYKIFKKKSVAPLLDTYLESFKTGCLPTSLRSALITLILKPGK